jgi:hypothetical protein
MAGLGWAPHVLPVLDIYRRYYGGKVALYILGTFYISMATAGFIVEGVFEALHLTEAIPTSTITKVNKVLGRWFVTKYGTKQGIVVIGRLAPFGIGAGIGGAGNALFGRTVVAGARRAFGPPPTDRLRRSGRRRRHSCPIRAIAATRCVPSTRV